MDALEAAPHAPARSIRHELGATPVTPAPATTASPAGSPTEPSGTIQLLFPPSPTTVMSNSLVPSRDVLANSSDRPEGDLAFLMLLKLMMVSEIRIIFSIRLFFFSKQNIEIHALETKYIAHKFF